MGEEQHDSTPNSRLKHAIDQLSDPVSAICAKTDIPKRTLYGLFKEGSTIKSDYLIALNREYGIDPSEILVGGAKYRTINDMPGVNNRSGTDIYRTGTEDEFYTIPFYASVKASAGGGIIPQDKEPLEIAFRKYFVNSTLKAQAKDLFAMMIDGDSMEPTLRHNDLVLIDKSKRTPKAGHIMVIRTDETVSCKRIQELPGSRLNVMSDNEAYDSYQVAPDQEGFEIIGTVIWFGRSL